ncbi:hypothetical protein SAMN04488057_1026 [Cyclobacterium lianum]|uniref:VOC domain-containing protein n=1 Tax=Cyclobacterium lianum TaxID=388280 RepID=A0A1M7JGQ4_9BACT|nr:hypothetical protein [Cyclobacterium lianum]SHM52145.1 hypothetical protein SAMN04488057_1026 [Cyclobacterium lianum]
MGRIHLFEFEDLEWFPAFLRDYGTDFLQFLSNKTKMYKMEKLNQVNEIAAKGLKAGGIEIKPMIDEGYMQIRKIEDFDGHVWHITHLNIEKFGQESK